MRAIRITRPGDPGVLEVCDVPRPDPGDRGILVRVRATAINRADLLQRRGAYPAPAGAPQDIPGLEYAGVVEAVGAGVTRWSAGDRVMGLVGGGSYAEYVITHEDEAVRVPDGLPWEQAAAVPEAFITAHDALSRAGEPGSGRAGSVLIHAVGSGVGTAALQLAKARGALVIGTQRSRWKLERARELGLDVALELDAPEFADAVLDATGGVGVDLVLDLVGGNYLNEDLRAVRTLGTIVLIGLVAGAKTELDLRLLLRRRATLIGTVLRARSLDEKIAAARAFEDDVLPLLESGAVRPIVDEVLPLGDAARAHEIVEANENFGKVVLRVD